MRHLIPIVLALAFSVPDANAQAGAPVDECGTVVVVQNCIFVQAGNGTLFLAATDLAAAGFTVGDTVRVVGRFHPFCKSACLTGSACLFPVTVTACGTGTSFCAGDGGDQLGCTDCPCNNNAPAGSGTGCLNSSGVGAELLAIGLPGVILDTLEFDVVGANPNTFAVLASGNLGLPTNPLSPCPAGSGVQSVFLDGLRCIASNVVRHGTRATNAAGEAGILNAGWGGVFDPPGDLSSGFVFGQTRNFQVFYREDVALVCDSGQNTTNAVSVVFGI